MKYLALALVLPLAGCVIADVTEVSPRAADIARAYASPTAFYAKSIVIPPGYETIRLPGIVADPVTPGGTELGDTERQAESVFRKIAATLAEIGAMAATMAAPRSPTVPFGRLCRWRGLCGPACWSKSKSPLRASRRASHA
jgi:hypothetical protein